MARSVRDTLVPVGAVVGPGSCAAVRLELSSKVAQTKKCFTVSPVNEVLAESCTANDPRLQPEMEGRLVLLLWLRGSLRFFTEYSLADHFLKLALIDRLCGPLARLYQPWSRSAGESLL